MKIRILPDETYEVMSKSKPLIGGVYNLEDAKNGTSAQNAAFHSLLEEYYKSGLWSYQGSGYNKGATLDEFKKLIKRKLGAGFESYVYIAMVDGWPKIAECEKREDIPAYVMNDPDKANYVRGRLKSWADYSKEERRKTMDNLISEMHQVGVNTKHFYEILEGMENVKVD
jgi:hypothetical protein